MNHPSFRVVVCTVALAALIFTGALQGAAQTALSKPAFSTEPIPGGNGDSGLYEAKFFTAVLSDGHRIEGKPVSDKAVARACTDRWKGGATGVNAARLLPTGGEGMAVAYPINDAFGLAEFTLALELRGRGWKADSGAVETLLAAEGDGGTVILLSDGKGNLVLRSKVGDVAGRAPACLDKVHSLIATVSKGSATLHWDGLPLGTGAASGLTKVKTITLGQTAPGPGDNKDIIRAEIYDRAFVQAQVSNWHLDVGIQPPAHVTLVKRQKPIVIDGVVNADEWADAAHVTGLVGGLSDAQTGVFGTATLANDQSEWWLSYDDEKLYVAHHSPPPARIAGQTQLVVAMLKRTMDKHDDALVFDDNIKLTFADSYPDVGDEKRIYINGQETTYEFMPLKWDPVIERKSRLTDTGWWVEASFRWADLNFGPPQDGKTIHLNLLRGWRQELDDNHLWTYGRYDAATGRVATEEYSRRINRDSPNPQGAVTLAGAEGVVVSLDGTGLLNRGNVNVAITMLNRTAREVKVHTLLDSNTGKIRESKDVALPPGARQPVEFKGTITDYATHTVTLRVVDAENGTEYFAQGWPVRRRYEPEIYIRKYRSQDLIVFEDNFEYLSAYPLADIQAELAICDRATKQSVHTEQLHYSSYTPRDQVSTKGWAVGQYDVNYRFTAHGQEIGRVSATYEHVALPPWWDTDVGNEDFKFDAVPYPFTDLAVNGATLDCVGRRYHFGDSLLPASIETMGKPILRAPMTVKAVTADGVTLSSDSAKCTRAEWTSKRKTRVEGVREIANDELTLRNEFWAEYDGFLWCKLTIVPKAGGKVAVKSLTFDIPLTPEFTDVMNAYEYNLLNTGRIHDWSGPTVPLWMGNGVGGIQWLNETDAQLCVKDLKQVLRLTSGTGEGATLRVTMINVPSEFDKPYAIEFGFVATPLRPKLLHTWKDPKYWGLRGELGGSWYPEGQDFAAAPDWGLRSGWKPGGANNAFNIPGYDSNPCYSGLARLYVTTGTLNLNNEDAHNFGDEWLASAGTRIAGVQSVTHASKRYVDYFVWRHWNAMQTQYPYQSWYFDGPAEVPSSNEHAGAGHVARDGRRVAAKGILGARDLCRRMYNVLIRWYPFGQVTFHSSGLMNMGYYGFCTELVDGENFHSILCPSQPTYLGALTPERFRAEYMGYNQSGNPSIFAGLGILGWEEAKLMGGGDAVMDHIHGLQLLHDIYPWGWVFGKDNSAVLERAGDRTWKAANKHALFTPFYDFVPYWEQKAVTPKPDLYASFYVFRHQEIDNIKLPAFTIFNDMTEEHKKSYRKVVCIFFNHSGREGVERVKLAWNALGFEGPQGVTAVNAVHSTGFRVDTTKDDKGNDVFTAAFPPRPEETARIEGDEVIFPMTKWNYRMIVLEKR